MRFASSGTGTFWQPAVALPVQITFLNVFLKIRFERYFQENYKKGGHCPSLGPPRGGPDYASLRCVKCFSSFPVCKKQINGFLVGKINLNSFPNYAENVFSSFPEKLQSIKNKTPQRYGGICPPPGPPLGGPNHAASSLSRVERPTDQPSDRPPFRRPPIRRPTALIP